MSEHIIPDFKITVRGREIDYEDWLREPRDQGDWDGYAPDPTLCAAADRIRDLRVALGSQISITNTERAAKEGLERALAAAQAKLNEVEAKRDALKEDAERLNAIRDNSWKLDPFAVPTGGGDSDIGWRVIQYVTQFRGDLPRERIVADVHTDDPRAAIDAARKK